MPTGHSAPAPPLRASGPPGSRGPAAIDTWTGAGSIPGRARRPGRDRSTRRPARRPGIPGRPAHDGVDEPTAPVPARPPGVATPYSHGPSESPPESTGPDAPGPGTSPGTRRPLVVAEHLPADPQHHRPVAMDQLLERRLGRRVPTRASANRPRSWASLRPVSVPVVQSCLSCRLIALVLPGTIAVRLPD